jgi:hypothetical protein
VNLRRVARWTAALIALLTGIALVRATIGFIPSYFSDKSQPDKSGYLGTIVGSASALVVIFQFLGWLRRHDSPDSIASQLRTKTGTELDRRLDDMRRTAEDIALNYRRVGGEEKTDLDGLADALFTQSGRVILTGQPGVGKSYTALQVAAAAIRQNPSIVPLVIPLSRWTGTEEPATRLAQFMQAEFNVSAPSAEELVQTGKILPIFDGLDELCADNSTVETAAELLRSLIDWHVIGSWAPFFLACRRSAWDRIDAELTRHHTLAVFSIVAVSRDEARQYLLRSVRANQTAKVNELMGSLQLKGHSYLLSSPWQLSLLAEIFRNLLNQPSGISIAELGKITDLATVDNLIAYYVESPRRKDTWRGAGIRRALDYWWLSNYAKYLDRQNSPTRDLVLHRLWPVAGRRAPRMVDLALCVTLSIPGFYWAAIFLWHRGLLARILLVIFGSVWAYFLVRTSTKPWVPAATPNWSRLNDPMFFLPQLGAAILIGVAAWLIVNPVIGAVCFLTAWLAIGLTVGFGQTLATDVQPKVVGPFGVLRHERQVSRFSAMAVFPVLAVGFTATWGARFGIVAAFAYCLVVGETVACALWRRYLAMIIASAFRLPPDPARFLKRMHTLGHLRIAGMSYQFRHDDVLRYFAQRDGLRGGRARISALTSRPGQVP